MTHKFLPSLLKQQPVKKGSKPPFILTVMTTLILAGGLVGCNQSSKPKAADPNVADRESAGETIPDNNRVAATAELFSGCYSVDEDKVPQIKISQQAGQIVMQTRESDTTKGVWNTPEPMHILPLDQVTHYFSEEAQNIDGLIARPDNIFAVAHVKSAYVNINPLLDSDYLGFILKGNNTIYKVACDVSMGS